MEAALSLRLVEALNRKGIEYCHWKSNLSLAKALSGEEDLDLLVDRRSLPEFLTVLAELGFKGALVRSGPNVPGVFHYYGLDQPTGRIAHVHLFSIVLTGESFVKSHFLPLERMLLENREQIGQVYIVSKPAELVLFVLRTFIKYGSLLDILRLAGTPDSLRSELQWLRAGADISEAVRLLEKYCPVVDKPLFLKCIETLDGQSSLLERVRLARKVRSRLRIYAKYTPLRRLLAYASFIWATLQRRLVGGRKNKTSCAGGLIVAFVGADATGKSTLVAESARWLGEVFAVRTVHAGKPPSTWLTAPVNKLALPVARRLWPLLRRKRVSKAGHSEEPGADLQWENGAPSLMYAIRAVTLAWDRYRLLCKARRWAANGEIVVCDRYPTTMMGAMDSARLTSGIPQIGAKGAVYGWLSRLEQRLYQRMPPPDIVLRLRVSLETAKQRNRARGAGGMDGERYLEARHRNVQDWRKDGTKYIYDIDTERPLQETILTVKKTIWDSL